MGAFSDLLSDVAGAFGGGMGAGIQRRQEEEVGYQEQERGFERLRPLRQKKRAEDVGFQLGPEAAQQVETDVFPGLEPYKQAAAAKRVEAEERQRADLARSLGYPMETIRPGPPEAGPAARADVLREPVPTVTRTPIERLAAKDIPLLKGATPRAGGAPSFEKDIAAQTAGLPSAEAFKKRQELREEYSFGKARGGAGGREAAGPTRGQQLTVANQYQTTPTTRSFATARDAYARLESVGKLATPAGDLALIFNYMKMLDPTSVVREGEFATAANAGSVPDRMINLYNRALEGTRLTDAQRQDFISSAARVFQSHVETQLQHEDAARQTAAGIGLPGDAVPDVIGRYRPRPRGTPDNPLPSRTIKGHTFTER